MSDLIKRYQELEKISATLSKEESELLGKKQALTEQRDQILKNVESFGIESVEDLVAKIKELQGDLTNKVNTIESKLTEFNYE
jgi:phage regulator Rha-like protein